MNRLRAIVTDVKVHEGVSSIHFDYLGNPLTMVGLEPPAEVAIGSKVILGIKASHLVLQPPEDCATSLENDLLGRIVEVQIGQILVVVTIAVGDQRFEAIVTRDAFAKLPLGIGERTRIGFLASELAIVEVVV